MPSESRRTIPEKTASGARPVLSTETLSITTSPSEPAVTIKFVNGTLAPESGARVAVGCVPPATERPVPVATGVVVVVSSVAVSSVVVDAVEQSAFAFAREEEPKYPVPAESPTGVKTSEAYLSWNLITAAFVRPPKKSVSLPAEPTPDEAICVAESEFKNCWRALTSAPELPDVRLVDHVCGHTLAVLVVPVGVPPAKDTFTLATVAASAPKDSSNAMIEST